MGFRVKGQFRDRKTHPISGQMYVKYDGKFNQPIRSGNYWKMALSSLSLCFYWESTVCIKWIKHIMQESAQGHCDIKNRNEIKFWWLRFKKKHL